MAPTLEWFVHHSGIKDLKFATGENRGDQIITSVNVLDNPDVVKWFKKNELIVNTGYIFRDDPEKQRTLIQEMHEIGCAGLVYKIKRYAKTIPEPLIDEARKLNFPIIEQPFFYSASEISRILFHEIYRKEQEKQVQAQNFILTLTNALFQHTDTVQLLQIIADFFKRPILLANFTYECISLSFPKGYDQSNHQKITEALNALCNLPESSGNHQQITLDDQSFTFFTLLLPDRLGYLCLLETDNELCLEETETLYKASQYIALSCERSGITDKADKEHNHSFLHFLINNSNASEDEIKNICTFYGFDYHSSKLCATFSLQKFKDKQKIDVFLNQVYQWLSHNMPDRQAVFHCANKNLLCLFFFFKADAHPLESLTTLKQIIQSLYEQLPETKSLPIGISCCHKNTSMIHKLFQESLQALRLQQLHSCTSNSYLHQLPYHLITNAYSKEEREELTRMTAQALLDFDRDNHTELTGAFKMYLHCRLNASEAAKKLYIHRNTFFHRLEKIKGILHTNLDDINEIFALYLGLCAAEMQQYDTTKN